MARVSRYMIQNPDIVHCLCHGVQTPKRGGPQPGQDPRQWRVKMNIWRSYECQTPKWSAFPLKAWPTTRVFNPPTRFYLAHHCSVWTLAVDRLDSAPSPVMIVSLVSTILSFHFAYFLELGSPLLWCDLRRSSPKRETFKGFLCSLTGNWVTILLRS